MDYGLCHRSVLKHEPDPWVIAMGGQFWIVLVLNLLVLPKIHIKIFLFVKWGICPLNNGIICCNCSSGLQIKSVTQGKLSFHLVWMQLHLNEFVALWVICFKLVFEEAKTLHHPNKYILCKMINVRETWMSWWLSGVLLPVITHVKLKIIDEIS